MRIFKYSYGFHYHNYSYLPKESNCNYIFFYACQYDYINIVEYFLKDKNLDINNTVILHINDFFF